ncbi:MAG: c-type cytochrome [Caldilineaceae bacterium]
MRKLPTSGFKQTLFRANKLAWITALLVVFTLAFAACAAPADTGGAAAEPAAEAEATEPPAEEEAAAEPTEPAEEEAAEAEATEEPAEEAAADAGAGDPVAGQYVFALTGGCGCHNNRDLGGLAGGNEFDTPAGKAYAPNITPDVDSGIGSWSAQDIATALQTGAEPDGEQLHPVMPYVRFSLMSNKEALDVAAYLMSLDPISNVVTETVLSQEPAAFTPAVAPPAEPSSDPVARGEQLVGLINCGGCHSPKNEDGSVQDGMLLAGSPIRDEFAANITPDEETGIGSWSAEEIAAFMQTGTFPDGSQVEGAMAQQIERRFSLLTDADAAAIAAYLKSIPAVVNAAPE